MPGMPGVAPLEDTNRIGKPSFAEVVRTSIESVNDLQSKSAQLREAYEKGENVPLTDVVLGKRHSLSKSKKLLAHWICKNKCLGGWFRSTLLSRTRTTHGCCGLWLDRRARGELNGRAPGVLVVIVGI
ncbi:MAG: hypothetical protein EB068_00050 [Betaproteobacteria bacterium]|nr:hypothetical protein [Betaproteobacteria bacterium]